MAIMKSGSASSLLYYFTERSHSHPYIHLTPRNAKSFGYTWIKDISVSVECIDLKNICYLVAEKGYELGQVADEKNNLALYGLYMPLPSTPDRRAMGDGRKHH